MTTESDEMPGPLPQNPDDTVRNAKPTIPTRELPTSGHAGPIPEPIEELGGVEARYYHWAWRTPAACGWHETDAEIVAEWARLKTYATACQRGEIEKTLASGKKVQADVSSAVYAQITVREDRLMLSPVARLKARAEIGDDPDDEPEASEATSRFEEHAGE